MCYSLVDFEDNLVKQEQVPLFAFNWGVGRGALCTFSFLTLHFLYIIVCILVILLPWILSGGMNKIFRVNELGIRSKVFSYV